MLEKNRKKKFNFNVAIYFDCNFHVRPALWVFWLHCLLVATCNIKAPERDSVERPFRYHKKGKFMRLSAVCETKFLSTQPSTKRPFSFMSVSSPLQFSWLQLTMKFRISLSLSWRAKINGCKNFYVIIKCNIDTRMSFSFFMLKTLQNIYSELTQTRVRHDTPPRVWQMFSIFGVHRTLRFTVDVNEHVLVFVMFLVIRENNKNIQRSLRAKKFLHEDSRLKTEVKDAAFKK